jgi:hypothetical protein
MQACNYARILHEQQKYEQATKVWKDARALWREAEPVLDDERALVLGWIDDALAACLSSKQPRRNPQYRVPLEAPADVSRYS